MEVVIAYVFPQVGVHQYAPLAQRFVRSYMENPPGTAAHKIKVVVNGGTPGPYHEKLFNPLPCDFISHNNVGRDIGAFQVAASVFPCDLLVCFGSHIYFAQPNWLDFIIKTYEDNGPAIYGNYAFHQPSPHIRTTNFWLSPQLLRSYPRMVTDDARYEFEHGTTSIVRHVINMGFPAYQLTWTGLYPITEWHHISLAEAIFFDQHTDRHGLA